ncbi:MAG: prolyl oligopeptidase [Myxococcota bacterium]|jgi:prolyl oligopeptidase
MLLVLLSCSKTPPAIPQQAYPAARREPLVEEHHGTPVADPYRWLEAPDSDETRAWVDAQNTLTAATLDAIPARDAIRARLEAVWQFETFGLPHRHGERTFYTHNTGEQEHSVLFVEEGGEARALLDPATLSTDGTVSLAGWEPSPDGNLLAYGLSDGGSDWRTWHVLDVSTGEVLSDALPFIKFSGATWTTDGTGFYYARYPEPDSPLEGTLTDQKLYHHTIGTAQSEDTLIYARPDEPEWGFGTRLSDDGQTLFVSTWRSTEDLNQLHTLDLTDPDAELTPLFTDWSAGWAMVSAEGRTAWLWTNLDAPRGRVVSVSLDDPTALTEVIPESEQTLDRTRRVGDQLLTVTLADARAVLSAYSLTGEPLGEVPLPGIGSIRGLSSRPGQTDASYIFSSFTTPPTIYRYDATTGLSTLQRQPEVAFDPADYHIEQVFYDSADGTPIPMFLVRRADLTPNGTTPTLLYGYGGFNISITPRFGADVVTWLDMGGVYAVANIRGGGEYGEAWHEAGTKLNKQNVFDDFIAAAEHLIASGITDSDHLAIKGRSNGGLLVGATLLQRPDLFGAALPGVGVLDMLRYHRFTIGRAWAGDYGTADDPAEFAALYAYSPVHNVVPGTAYPATLITTADHDDRVVPAHSYKFAAALQHGQGGPEPIRIRIDTRAGHGAGRSVSQQVAEVADTWAFLVEELGVEIPAGFGG